MPFPLLVFCCVAVPLLELWVLIQVVDLIGLGWTLLLLAAEFALGATVIKHEGRKAWARLVQVVHEGRTPDRELADGALLIIGGVLVLVPGFVTDVIGFVCLLPFTRPAARAVLLWWVRRRRRAAGESAYAPRTRGGAHQIYRDLDD